ncbi:MAG: NYN domain-containing protein [Candidatus Omnitrophica bacterium]|nr:NYN domain-containing protein [Candidatus Omnitrophota bacterium]
MSLHYLLDGYNLTNKMPGADEGSLEERRKALMRYIEVTRPQGSPSNKVTIVFDGRDDVYSFEQGSAVKVIFTKGNSADDKIKDMVEESRSRGSTVVVSDDREIQSAVRAMGASFISVREFFNKGRKTKKNQQGKNIPKALEMKITQEFKDIWIKK